MTQGRVAVDGRPIDSPAFNVRPDQRVTVDGEALPALQPVRLWRYHKPAGLLTTASDPQGRPTLYDRLPPSLPRVMPIGRLDLNSEGLLLLTNDGGLKRQLELPATGWVRRYRVRVHGQVDAKALQSLTGGVTIDGVTYGAIDARLDEQRGANAWLTVSLREGKNREVRRVCEYLGYPVNRLIRLAYGPFQLGSLARDGVEEVTGKVLREQLGAKLGALVGAAPPAREGRPRASGGTV